MSGEGTKFHAGSGADFGYVVTGDDSCLQAAALSKPRPVKVNLTQSACLHSQHEDLAHRLQAMAGADCRDGTVGFEFRNVGARIRLRIPGNSLGRNRVGQIRLQLTIHRDLDIAK